MAKKAITYILNEKTLKSLVNHDGVDALNKSFWYHRERTKGELTKTEKEIFFLINKYSVKYHGVSYMSHRTIAESLGCSTKTVQRAYRRLVDLGVIEVFEAKRTSDMKQTASIVRIVRFEEPVDLPAENNVQQATGQNVQPKTPSPKHTLVSSNAFEEPTYTRAELAISFGIPEPVVYAVNSLQLSNQKFVELFSRDGLALRDALFKRIPQGELYRPLVNWTVDHPAYLKSLKSAAIRTAFMTKNGNVQNPVGYFLATYCALCRVEMANIEAEEIAV